MQQELNIEIHPVIIHNLEDTCDLKLSDLTQSIALYRWFNDPY